MRRWGFILPASSPQAKGRIERNHGTHQDRLVKKLRRHGVRDLAAANAFLAAQYWADHNTRFAQAPGAAEDFHARMPSARRLAEIFRLETRRVVANDWVVRYHNRLFQLERRSPLPPAHSGVLVCEDEAGGILIRYRGAVVRHTELTGVRAVVAPVVAAASAPTAPSTARGPARPCIDHPWRRASESFRYARALGLARQAWRATAVPSDIELTEDEGTFLSSQ